MRGPGAQHHGALDDVLELANVARPVVLGQQVERVRRQLESALAGSPRRTFEEVVDEQRDVVLAIAQRRQLNRDDVEAVEEILAELPSSIICRRSTLVAAMMRTSTLIVSMPPRRMKSRSWMTRSSFGLRLERDVADLVEEDAALVGEVEHPLLRIDGAGERALDVAEQRGLEQIRRQVARVHGDERALGPRRVGVDRARDQLLAGAALALNEDRRPARRRLDDQVEHLTHPRAPADDVRELVVPLLDVLPQVAVLVHQPRGAPSRCGRRRALRRS